MVVDENWDRVDTENLERCYADYAAVLEFFSCLQLGELQAGFLTIMLDDYRTLPAVTLDVLQMYIHELDAHRRKSKMPGYGLN